MRFSFIYHSRKNDVFEPGFLDDRVGDEITFRKDMGGSYTGTLVSATVINDGQSVEVTMEIDDPEIEEVLKPKGLYTVGEIRAEIRASGQIDYITHPWQGAPGLGKDS